jgi:hypothetical protein
VRTMLVLSAVLLSGCRLAAEASVIGHALHKPPEAHHFSAVSSSGWCPFFRSGLTVSPSGRYAPAVVKLSPGGA